MRVLITGICGFVGSALAIRLKRDIKDAEIMGIDNFSRPGSELNTTLAQTGIRVFRGDLRCWSDIEGLPAADWVVDAAANPSVLAGVDGQTTVRQLFEHNLIGTINVLEYCRRHRPGLIMLSTSRVYSIRDLASIPTIVKGSRLVLDHQKQSIPGISEAGITEEFSTAAPISLYGSSKLASENIAAEYGHAFHFPVIINRCGVIAGAGQFGTAEQGIFSYWIHAWKARKPLTYIGFGGKGFQVRDALHPDDLAALLTSQMNQTSEAAERLFNVGGGPRNSLSLSELSEWCAERFGPHNVTQSSESRPFDLPWVVMDSRRTEKCFGWRVARGMDSILEEIASHAETHPDWLKMTCG
jgi:CDP-paratose 2-epimerase